jgi:hypothetical protein
MLRLAQAVPRLLAAMAARVTNLALISVSSGPDLEVVVLVVLARDARC